MFAVLDYKLVSVPDSVLVTVAVIPLIPPRPSNPNNYDNSKALKDAEWYWGDISR